MAGQTAIELAIDLTWDDVREFLTFDGFGASWLRHYRRLFVAGFAAVAVVCAVELFVFTDTGERIANGALMALAFLGAAAPRLTWDSGWHRARTSPDLSGMVGPRRITLDAVGITINGPHAKRFIRWHGVRKVVQFDGSVYMYTGPHSAEILPRSAFSSREAAIRVCEVAGNLAATAPRLENPSRPRGLVVTPSFGLTEQHLLGGRRVSHFFRPTRSEVFLVAVFGTGALYLVPMALNLRVALALISAGIAWWTFGGPCRLREFRAAVKAEFEEKSRSQAISLGINEQALFEETPVSQSLEPWSAISAIDAGDGVTVFRNNRGSAYILPRDAFPSPDAYFDFVERALEYRRAALSATAA